MKVFLHSVDSGDKSDNDKKMKLINQIKKNHLYIRIILGVSLLIFVYYHIGFGNILKVLIKIDIFKISVSLPLYFILLLLNYSNIHLLFKAMGKKLKFIRAFYSYITSWSIGTFTPGRLGDLSLAFSLNKEGIAYGTSLSILIADKIVTTFLYLVICIVSSIFLFKDFLQPWISGVILATLFLLIIFFLFFSEKIRDLLKRIIFREYTDKLKGFHYTFKTLFLNKIKWIMLNIVITAINIINSALIYSLTFWALGLEVNFLWLLLVSISVSSMNKIISLIPITLSGLGIRETVGVYLYSLAGIPASASGGVYIITLLTSYTLALSVLAFKRKLGFYINS